MTKGIDAREVLADAIIYRPAYAETRWEFDAAVADLKALRQAAGDSDTSDRKEAVIALRFHEDGRVELLGAEEKTMVLVGPLNRPVRFYGSPLYALHPITQSEQSDG